VFSQESPPVAELLGSCLPMGASFEVSSSSCSDSLSRDLHDIRGLRCRLEKRIAEKKKREKTFQARHVQHVHVHESVRISTAQLDKGTALHTGMGCPIYSSFFRCP
jgi:hypothetical protein